MPGYTSFAAMEAAGSAQAPLKTLRGSKGKMAILMGGAAIRTRRYQRASSDSTGREQSCQTQSRKNIATDEENGWTSIGSYTDNDRAASRRAKKPREDFERLLEDIKADPGDVLIMFEMARSQRDLEVYARLRNLCLDSGLYYWMVADELYDLRNRGDKQQLTAMASRAEDGSDAIGEAVLAGLESQAKEGRPHGQTPFGYLRVYSTTDGEFEAQVLDEKDHGGWSAAGVVRLIFEKYLAGIPARRIAEALNDLGVPTMRAYAAMQRNHKDRIARWETRKWREGNVYKVLKNTSYMGLRLHRGILTKENCWPALVSRDDFFAAARRMESQAFSGERPMAAQTLLTCLARCGKCGDDMVHQGPNAKSRHAVYRCRAGDSSVPAGQADEFVVETLLEWFANPVMGDALQEDKDEKIAAAKALAENLRGDLLWWRRRAEDQGRPDVTLEDYDRKFDELMPQILKAEADAAPSGVSGVVQNMMSKDARRKWKAMGLEQRRAVLRESVKITVHPAGRGRRNVPIVQRVHITKAF